MTTRRYANRGSLSEKSYGNPVPSLRRNSLEGATTKTYNLNPNDMVMKSELCR